MKLLIVDDEVQIRLGLAEAIDWRAIGIDQVLTADNGLDALAQFEAQQPEIVITDIRMPGVSGLEFTESIKRLAPATRVILLSGYADFQYAQQGIRLGVMHYELKPVKIPRLTGLVRDAALAIREEQSARGQGAQDDPFDSAYDAVRGQIDPAHLSPWIRAALGFIRENYRSDITVDSVAGHVQKTPNYFSNRFASEVGMSFVKYLNTVRIEAAKMLMADASQLAYEISERVGFRDYKYFIQVFKRHEGVTPTEYRKRAMTRDD